MKNRLDEAMVARGLVQSRSHAARLIKLGKVRVGAMVALKPSQLVFPQNTIVIEGGEDYVSRAGYKLAEANKVFRLDFSGKTVLDVGSSTGGFTDYALQRGASKIIAVDVGTNQLHQSLRDDARIELHEKTDIRTYASDFSAHNRATHEPVVRSVDIIMADLSFISLREVVPSLLPLMGERTIAVLLCKPQFEAGRSATHKGVIKNDATRRVILKEFEDWIRQFMVIVDKADSQVAGSKGNVERFYLLKKLKRINSNSNTKHHLR